MISAFALPRKTARVVPTRHHPPRRCRPIIRASRARALQSFCDRRRASITSPPAPPECRTSAMVANHSFIRGIHRPAKVRAWAGHREARKYLNRQVPHERAAASVWPELAAPPVRDRDKIRRRRAHVDEQRRALARAGRHRACVPIGGGDLNGMVRGFRCRRKARPA